MKNAIPIGEVRPADHVGETKRRDVSGHLRGRHAALYGLVHVSPPSRVWLVDRVAMTVLGEAWIPRPGDAGHGEYLSLAGFVVDFARKTKPKERNRLAAAMERALLDPDGGQVA